VNSEQCPFAALRMTVNIEISRTKFQVPAVLSDDSP